MKKLVYIVSIYEYDGDVELHDLSDEDFAVEARRQDNVLTLEDFINDFNDEQVAPSDCKIRLLPDGLGLN